MNKTKKILAVIITISTLFAFSACSKQEYVDKVVTVTNENGEAVTDIRGEVVTEIVTEGDSKTTNTTKENISGNKNGLGTNSSSNNDGETSNAVANQTTKKNSNKTTKKKEYTTKTKTTTTKSPTTTKAPQYLTIKIKRPVENVSGEIDKYVKENITVYIGSKGKDGTIKYKKILSNSYAMNGKTLTLDKDTEINDKKIDALNKKYSGTVYLKITIADQPDFQTVNMNKTNSVTFKNITHIGIEEGSDDL